ncbi:MAG: fused MFS/spermidine synthase [Desulfobaccales bacterium]
MSYDLIFGDAYNGIRSIPSHLLTREFFQAVKNRLRERGIFMMHLINAVQGKNAVLFISVDKTLSQVFRERRVFATNPRQPAKIQSIIIMAADFDLPLESVLATLPPEKESVRKLLQTCLSPAAYASQEGYILTDRFNPVEYLIARTLK